MTRAGEGRTRMRKFFSRPHHRGTKVQVWYGLRSAQLSMAFVDFLSELPVEVVEHILCFLDVSDILKSLRVSKRWNSLLTSSRLDQHWKTICLKQLGITKARLVDYQQRQSLIEIASSVLRHLQWVRGFMSKIDQLDRGKDSLDCSVKTPELFRFPRLIMNRYPQDNLTLPSCFIGHNFVLCSPLFFREPHLTIAAVCTMTKTISASRHNPLRTCLERPRQSWVFWAKASANYVLVLIQPEGRWIGYCPLTGKIVLDAVSAQARVLLAGGCVAIASCECCFLVVAFKAVNDEAATWDMSVLKLGRPADDNVTLRSCDVVCTKSIVVKLKADSETTIEWILVPHTNDTERGTSANRCRSSHQLLCITNTRIHIYLCTVHEQITSEVSRQHTDFVMVKVGELVIPDSPHHVPHPDTGLFQLTSIRCSLDGHLLGLVVHPSQFYVWDLHTHDVILSTNLSRLYVIQTSQSENADAAASPALLCRVLAVGHLYSVVVVLDEKPGGQICIISTTSGELLSRRESRVQWRVHEGRDYIHLVNREWLSDVFCFNAPFFTYLNRSPLSQGTSAQPVSCVQFLHHSKVRSVS